MLKKNFQFKILNFAFLVASLFLVATCSDKDEMAWPDGKLNKKTIQNIHGFPDQRDSLLKTSLISMKDFNRLSTDSAWSLNETDRTTLKNFRSRLPFPKKNTVLQKVISLQEVATYMNNTYNGTIGGYFSVAADIKTLKTMHEIYYGLRLDYNGSQFLPDGAGYAVIRFTSSFTNQTNVPYCVEMGGNKPHSWPGTGGGFTSSTLGEGGYPEYCFINYFPPDQGAELYEVTPKGNEILRATFQYAKWTTTEPRDKGTDLWINPIRNGIFGLQNSEYKPIRIHLNGRMQIENLNGTYTDYSGPLVYIETHAYFKHKLFRVWGLNENHNLLTTLESNIAKNLDFIMNEPWIFSKTISINQVDSIFEKISLH